MRKIMFNDKFLLTDAVLRGDKTMTRRNMPKAVSDHCKEIAKYHKDESAELITSYALNNATHYEPEEVIAVGTNYEKVYNSIAGEAFFSPWKEVEAKTFKKLYKDTPGWTNKMFVKPGLMEYKIKIKSVGVELLQEISPADCIREGIRYRYMNNKKVASYKQKGVKADDISFATEKEAFASLIDKINGAGTWKRNPYVFVYEFELTW